MDQIKIGKFIAELRKEHNLTQEQLAEKLGVSNRSVSRWENGKNMPDVSLFTPLCELFEITVNELIYGEKIPVEKIVEQSELNTVNVIKEHRKIKIWLKSILVILLILILVFGTWQGIQIYKVYHGVTYYEDIYTYDTDVNSVLSEIDNFLKSKDCDDFIIDTEQCCRIILNSGKIEDMYFEGSTESTNTNFYFNIYSNDKKPDRLQIFIGKLDDKKVVKNGIVLNKFIEMINSLDFKMILNEQSNNQIIISFWITDFENESSIYCNDGSPRYIIENNTTKRMKNGDVLNGNYVQITFCPNGGTDLANVYFKL